MKVPTFLCKLTHTRRPWPCTHKTHWYECHTAYLGDCAPMLAPLRWVLIWSTPPYLSCSCQCHASPCHVIDIIIPTEIPTYVVVRGQRNRKCTAGHELRITPEACASVCWGRATRTMCGIHWHWLRLLRRGVAAPGSVLSDTGTYLASNPASRRFNGPAPRHADLHSSSSWHTYAAGQPVQAHAAAGFCIMHRKVRTAVRHHHRVAGPGMRAVRGWAPAGSAPNY